MLIITDEQKIKFKNICSREFTTDIKYINIVVLNNIPDIIQTLLINNTSFNYLIDKDGVYNLVDNKYLTNGGYKLTETIYCNKNVPHLTYGIIPVNELSMLQELLLLKQKLFEFAVTNKVRLALGNNVHILTPDKETTFYKYLSKEFIIDTTFKYFSSLFVL